MAATATIASAKHLSKDGSLEIVSFPVVFSGSYPGTPGDTLDLTGLPIMGLGRAPIKVDLKSLAGYRYEYDPGSKIGRAHV